MSEPRRQAEVSPEEDDAGPSLAAPDSLLGQLQRGRGLGVQRAVTEPDAPSALLECLAHDPRWDRQSEERGEYYANLALQLGVGVDRIPADPRDPDFPLTLAFDVLVELSRSGSPDAAAMLHRYFAEAPQPQWWVVDHLWREAGEAGRQGLAEVVLSRVGDAELADAVDPSDDGPWRAWALVPRVRDALERAQPRPVPPRRPDLHGASSEALLALAETQDYRERSAAFRELSARGATVLLDVAERTDLRNGFGVIPALAKPIVDLGPAALPRARTWLTSGDDWLTGLGQRVISAHGDSNDGPTVLTWFEEAIAEAWWYTSEDYADGLARLRYAPALRSLMRAWEVTGHSHARASYLRALLALKTAHREDYLGEAALDCESEVRHTARTAR